MSIAHKLEIKMDKSQEDKLIMNKLEKFHVAVGLWGEGDSPTDNMAYRGAIQEYGVKIRITPKMRNYLRSQGLPLKESTEYIVIPKRSFMRETLDTEKIILENYIAHEIKLMLERKQTMKTMFDKIGLKHQNQIKNQILNGDYVANHPFTLSQKSSTKPLIGDSGGLHINVTYKVGIEKPEKPQYNPE